MNKDNKRFIVETNFLHEALKNELSLKEFLVLVYFDNESDYTFDVKKLSKATCLSEEDALVSFGTLVDKKLITLSSIKDNKSGKFVDRVVMDNFYKGIKADANKKSKEDTLKEFYTKFQEGYKHSLSAMDYEIINAWIASGLSEELILGAVKEASYNGVLTLRYIDKILFEWKKKEFKTMDDVEKYFITKDKGNDKSKEENLYETSIMEYNWLDEE